MRFQVDKLNCSTPELAFCQGLRCSGLTEHCSFLGFLIHIVLVCIPFFCIDRRPAASLVDTEAVESVAASVARIQLPHTLKEELLKMRKAKKINHNEEITYRPARDPHPAALRRPEAQCETSCGSAECA